MTNAPELIGTRVGRYDVLSLLGRGGMGAVYDAVDSSLGRHVALKILPVGVTGDASRRARFVQEARAASALNHPNVVAIYEIGHALVGTQDLHFIAMEKVDGGDLAAALAGTRLPVRRAVELVAQIADAIAAAHSAGIVHRDLKPGNIVLSREGVPKVLDFGLAKLRPGDESWSIDGATAIQSTDSGVILGTVGYMSPEQAQGKAADHRSDIFSLGCILYEAVAGRRAFAAGSPVETLHALINAEPSPLSESNPSAPAELQRITGKAMAKNADERYQSAREMAIDLRAMLRDESRAASREKEARPSAWRWMALAGAGLAIILLIGFAVTRSRSRPPEPQRGASPPVPRQLTTSRGYSGTPAISPDGQRVAYASTRTGSLEIYVASLAPGSAEVALTFDGGQNHAPAWSPDGRWLAYASIKRQGIWIVPATGGAARQVIEFGLEPSWSPDGERLVFATGIASNAVLWTVKRDGSDRKAITRIGAPRGGHAHPSWSHDGRFIAFEVGYGSRWSDVFILSLADGKLRHIGGSQRPIALTPCFSAADDALYWGGSTDDGNGRIWRAPLDKDTGAVKGPLETVLTLDARSIGGISISRDGTSAMTLLTDDANLWTVDLDGDGRPGEPARLTDEAVRVTRPDYSSDGRIAFTRLSIGRPASTWFINEDGSGLTPLLVDEPNRDPQWSKDNSRVLVRKEPGGSQRLSWIDAATRRATDSIDVTNGDEFKLSPDGKLLAYHVISANGAMNAWIRPLEGGPARRVTNDPRGAAYPVWSPDGKWLALELMRGDHTQVGVVPSAGGAIQQLTDGPGQAWVYSWSPDGDRIAFAGQRDGVWNVWDVSRTTRATRQLTHFTSANGFVRYPDWSPRGNRIVFERTTTESSIWTVVLPGGESTAPADSR